MSTPDNQDGVAVAPENGSSYNFRNKTSVDFQRQHACFRSRRK